MLMDDLAQEAQERAPRGEAAMRWWLEYLAAATCLFVTRRIRFRALGHCLRHYPVALADDGGAYIVEPSFEVGD
jgi:alkanesulfonate monooxygenase SsuD/methylene tetrahydromethanopterin reductase-like flavin-dependent oxidoreductase (luciferase family)